MGQDACMESFGGKGGTFQCKILLLLLAGTCLGLKVTVPSHIVHGIKDQPLYLPVHYGFHMPASDIQIIWLFERPSTMPKYLLGSVNQSVVPDLEYRQKFTMMPPNASLLINPLEFTDEGNYIVKVNIQGNGTLSASQKIQVTVDEPITKPVVQIRPSSGAVEYVDNMTMTCQVKAGTRLLYHWLKNGKPLRRSPAYSFSPQNNTFQIAPVTKEDAGNYTCLVKNPVSEMESDIIAPTIYYGPYGLQVNSDKGLKVGEVFTVDLGEAILFDCSADSYPPNTYSWIGMTDNTTYFIKHGPRLEVAPEKVAQMTADYACCAYNNVTGRQDETHFTVIITSMGLESSAQKEKSLSPLASLTGISLFLIISMCLLFLWKKFQPYKVIKQKLEGRPETDYRKAQTFSGHEDALDDFGIYEFVAFPDAAGVPRMPSRSVRVSEGVSGQDVHNTIYEVIQHIPAQQQDHLE
ncbi:HEPACAM family member 2 isoform X2 [Ochotona curzoniae]|uniref:HEPACAM family member 2 isoform X1 n=1 Tax=Ochotona curzoniae TaxID=130825 RepID=UPI001B34D15A|nr:HEPACAM family member 2 isoform X1 [Ochotona curzoniae]XP_040821042.1 HEPACAM family member 2 isoform X2 [Ochotona curzoniae]